MTKKGKRLTSGVLTGLLSVSCAVGFGIMKPVRANAAEASATPVARYVFNEESVGKDATGGYDMNFYNQWIAGGTGPVLDKYTLEDGGITFTAQGDDAAKKALALAQPKSNNVFEKLHAFTLCFSIKIGTANVNNAHYIGVGNSVSKQNFAFVSQDNQLSLRVKGDGQPQLDLSVPGVSTSAWTDIIATAQPGGDLVVYMNGEEVAGTRSALVNDWTAYDSSSTFSIGSSYNGACVDSANGALKDIEIYNFAMDDTCAKSYASKKEVSATDLRLMARVEGFKVDRDCFTDGEPLKEPANSTMSAKEILSLVNPALPIFYFGEYEEDMNARNFKSTEKVKWTDVEKVGNEFYAVGTVDISKVYFLTSDNLTNEVRYLLPVTQIREISEPVFEGGKAEKEPLNDQMTVETMAGKINGATVSVILGDGTEKTADVTFDRVEYSGGKYYACGDLVVENQKLQVMRYELSVSASGHGLYREVLPIAKYEFKDPSNPGKDTMGNFDLTARPTNVDGMNASPSQNETAKLPTVENGRAYFDGESILACPMDNDIGDYITNGFTLTFTYQQTGAQIDWSVPIGFGSDSWTARNKYCSFMIDPQSGNLRIATTKGKGWTNGGDIIGSDPFWAPMILSQAPVAPKAHTVTISARAGGKFTVFLDGEIAQDGGKDMSWDVPAGWNFADDQAAFAIGGMCIFFNETGNAYSLFKGWVSDVTVYNCALNLEQVKALTEKGEINASDMRGEIVVGLSTDTADVVFENGQILVDESRGLNDNLKYTNLLTRVNNAFVKATFEDETLDKVSVPLTWVTLSKEGSQWYLVGKVNASDIGYISEISTEAELKFPVEVKAIARQVEVAEKVRNGKITPSVQTAYLGDTIIFTVTPDEGYVVEKVTVTENYVEHEIKPNANGVYSYTVSEIDKIEYFATFVLDNAGKDNSNGGGSILGIVLGVIGGVLVLGGVAAAVSIVLVKKKRASAQSEEQPAETEEVSSANDGEIQDGKTGGDSHDEN